MSRRDPESSLELLLDAMCNTFGGVMFIAISLVVVMSMLSRISAKTDPEKLHKVLSRQQQELKSLRRTAAENLRAVEQLQQDPRRKQAAELVKLTGRKTALAAELARLETRLHNENMFCKAEKADQKKLIRTAERLQKKRENLAAAIRQERNALAMQREQLAKMSAAPPLHFRIQERSSRQPYFYILCRNRAWRVGPELQGKTMEPSPDCAFQKDAPDAEGCRTVHCRAIPDRGVPVCTPAGTLSPEFLQQLSAIPENRVPYFKLDRASLKSFCILREYLNKHSRLHGVAPALENNEGFDYSETSRKAEYYY